MKFNRFLWTVLAAVSLTSCHKGKWGYVNGKGDLVTETRAVSGFDQIHLSMNADVTFVQDSIYSLEISAQSNIMGVLDIEVKNQTLKLDFSRNVWKHKTVHITVHAPTLRGLDISGSGNIAVSGPLQAQALKLNVSGSGNIAVPLLQADQVESRISGSGNILISGGTTGSATANISGSGDIETGFLIAQNSEAKISGSGNISTHAVQQLTARISGSGDITYRGTPGVDVNISGSGKLKHID